MIGSEVIFLLVAAEPSLTLEKRFTACWDSRQAAEPRYGVIM